MRSTVAYTARRHRYVDPILNKSKKWVGEVRVGEGYVSFF